MSKISVQLYSVRDDAGKDYAGTIRKIAAMGYTCVEPAGFPNFTLEKAVAVFKELGLKAPSCHTGFPVGDNANKILDEAQALGVKYIVSGKGPDQFKTKDTIKAVADEINAAAANAAKRGLTIGVHNHWWEAMMVDGVPAYQILDSLISKDVVYEIDAYWIKVGGLDPAEVITGLGKRAPMIHIKDGPCVKDQPMQALGAGKLDIPAIVNAAKDAELLIVELDSVAPGVNMLEAIATSYTYLSKVAKTK